MTFEVAVSAYAAFMGRWSTPLGALFLTRVDERVGPVPGRARVLDVGCGPGVLTALLVDRYGAGAVAAIDPSPPFVEAARALLPGVDVRSGPAESLPWPDGTFDRCLAQLVVPFMADPTAGIGEMRRVTRAGGSVAVTAWDHAGRRSPLSPVWEAVHQTDPDADDESGRPGCGDGRLASLLTRAGLVDVRTDELRVTLRFATFEQWWDPHESAAGPIRRYVDLLDPHGRRDLRERCRAVLPEPPFELDATAWCAVGTVRPAQPRVD